MKIAVLMSCYNGENYIKEQIESILAQNRTYETEDHQQKSLQVDIWVRDDGSRDATCSILQDYEKQQAVQWFLGDNMGPACSFFDLMKRCTGYDYYAFSDQDDIWNEEKLFRAVTFLEKIGNEKKCPYLYLSNAELVDEDMTFLGRNVYKQNPKLDFETVACAGGLLGCTMVMNEDLAELVRLCPLSDSIIMHDFYSALVCTACGGRIIYDECATMKYRQHHGNVVGVAQGFFGKLKDRFGCIFYKSPISISKQAENVLSIYGEYLMPGAEEWLHKVACYRKNIWNRICLACSHRTKYINMNMGLTNRLAILFGSK